MSRAPRGGVLQPARLRGGLLVLVCMLAAGVPGSASASVRPAHAAASHAKKKKPNKSSGCKAGYVKQTRVVHKKSGHKKVTKRVSVCVKSGSGNSSGGSGGSSGSGSGSSGSGSGGTTPSGPPSVASESYSVVADGNLSLGAPGVLTGAHGTSLTAQLISGTAHGTLTLGHDGSFSYAPNSGFVGTDSFTYKAVDKSFNSSNGASVTITVTPSVVPASYSATSGTPLSIPAPGLLAGAVGGGLAVTLVSNVSHGTLTLASNGSFTYTATPGYVGSDGFTYDATDAAGGVSNTAPVTINVGQAGPPDVTPQTFSGEVANTELRVGGASAAVPEVYLAGQSALAGDSDPGGGTLSTIPGAITTAHGGTATMASDGTFTYSPPVGYEGPSDSFSFTVDSTDGQSSQASVTIDFASGRVWYVSSSRMPFGSKK